MSISNKFTKFASMCRKYESIFKPLFTQYDLERFESFEGVTDREVRNNFIKIDLYTFIESEEFKSFYETYRYVPSKYVCDKYSLAWDRINKNKIKVYYSRDYYGANITAKDITKEFQNQDVLEKSVQII